MAAPRTQPVSTPEAAALAPGGAFPQPPIPGAAGLGAAGLGNTVTTGAVWLRHRSSFPGAAGVAPERPAWHLPELAGRFVEVAGTAALTAAVVLVADAQARRETVVWIARAASSLYPPDAVSHGLDPKAVPTVFLPDTSTMLRAADVVLRCGGFGLAVMDGIDPARLALSAQQRLGGLARQQNCALLVLRGGLEGGRSGAGRSGAGRAPSSLVSLRVVADRERVAPGRFRLTLHADKDKRRAQGWDWQGEFRGPVGLH